jgi:hypothetical protein
MLPERFWFKTTGLWFRLNILKIGVFRLSKYFPTLIILLNNAIYTELS